MEGSLCWKPRRRDGGVSSPGCAEQLCCVCSWISPPSPGSQPPLPRLSAPPLLVAGLEDQLTASQRLPTGRGNDGGGCGPRRTPVVHRHVSGDRGCRGARRSRPGAHEPFRYLGDRPVLPELRAQVRGSMPGQIGEDDGLLHSTCLFCVCVNVFMCDQ